MKVLEEYLIIIYLLVMRIQLAEIEIVDKDLLEMINYMDNYYSNNTVFIILEDHGSRYGLYRQTLQGKLEERLPALFILVPPKLLENFPYIKKNLEINRKRLVTAFDLHETILSIFKLGQTDLIFPKKDNHELVLMLILNYIGVLVFNWIIFLFLIKWYNI
jgi:hypothetical protein